ncbi:MAG: hypothetical protein ACXV7J_04340 [Methylomonas sp.]
MKTFLQRINDLANYLDDNDHHREVAFEVISKLRQSHDEASKNQYPKPELYDLVFSKNDCLATKGANELPEKMVTEIRNLQEEIVDAYGVQDD